MRYIPKIREASVPEDGGWIEIDQKDVLVLSIPEWSAIIHLPSDPVRSVWMYDRIEDAYLFCFELQQTVERAVAFPREHAGRLLQDQRAHRPFSMMITDQSLRDTTRQIPCLYFPDIRLKRHPKAGW